MIDEKLNNKEQASASYKDVVSGVTFHFADWVNGKFVDEIFKAIDRKDAERIMNDKYPNHKFALAQELI